MIQLITRNFGWKLLSLAIAAALWIAVAREPELATSLSAPVEFKNMPEDVDFNSAVPDHVQLELRGQSGRLSHDNLADVAVVLDLADAHPGERTYTIRDSSLNLPSAVSFYRAIPSQLTLRFEHVISRDIPVKPLYEHIPQGYRVQSANLYPDKVRIRGPEQRVRNMDAVSTDPIDLTGVVGQKEIRTHVNVGDPQVRLESQVIITAKVQVALQRSTPKAAK
ncbi:MAG TPA: CdaR family protein [Bryobacteraceae bacterium]|nr:CdaR family protein [Bryobacteraceae bacterium]